MRTMVNGKLTVERVASGTEILAAARATDTSLVRGRLDAFANAHLAYCDAQKKVDIVEAQVRSEQARVAELDAEQDRAVEMLAVWLATEGQPRVNPFAAFGLDSPALIKALPYGEEARVVHSLVSALQQTQSLSPATLAAAAAAEKAAHAVQAALPALDVLLPSIREARERRDAIGKTWDATLSSLKRGVRAAADDGAPGLYGLLFGKPTRTRKKPTATSESSDPGAPQTPTPAAA